MDQGSASTNSSPTFDDSKIKQEPYYDYDEEGENETYSKQVADRDTEAKTGMIAGDYIAKSQFPVEFGLPNTRKIKEEPKNECAEDQATKTSIKQEVDLDIIEGEPVIKQESESIMMSGVPLESDDEETKVQSAVSEVSTSDGQANRKVLKGASKGGRDDRRREIQKLQHIKDHTPLHTSEKSRCREKRFACDVCGRRFGLNHHMMTHMLTHTGEKPFACDLCDYRTITKSNVKRHLRTHTGQRPFACDLCCYRANQKKHLNVHKRTRHVRGNPLALDGGEYKTDPKLNLRRLKTIHTGKKKKTYECETCSCWANKRSNLQAPTRRIHKGEKTFVDGCDYPTSGKSNLTARKSSPNEEKPLDCSSSDQLQKYLLSVQMTLGSSAAKNE